MERKSHLSTLTLLAAVFVVGMGKIPTASAVSPVIEMYNRKTIESENKAENKFIEPEDKPARKIEEEKLIDALRRGIPQDVVGKTYRGKIIEACIEPKYIEAVDHAHNEAATHEEGKKKGAALYRFLVDQKKCAAMSDKSPEYEYTVLETYDFFMRIYPRHAQKYDLETLGMVKIEVHTHDEAFPKILFITIAFPGVTI